MKKFILPFLGIIFIFISCSKKEKPNLDFSSFKRAKQHNLKYGKPAVDFFEGALLGNGGMGVVVTTRPDGILLHFGHNNIWDIRIAEDYREEIGTFDYVFNKVNNISDTLSQLTQDSWYKNYLKISRSNYSKPYPRPFPAGSVLLGFDPRKVELIGHNLKIENGLCEVNLLTNEGKKLKLKIFTDMKRDKLWIRLVDDKGNPYQNIFDRIRLIPDPSTPEEFPELKREVDLNDGQLAFRQTLPYEEPDKYNKKKGHPKDEAFRIKVSVNNTLEKKSKINWSGNEEKMRKLESGFAENDPNEAFLASVSLVEGMDTLITNELPSYDKPTRQKYKESLNQSTRIWKEYWKKSGVKLEDEFLEKIWYHNLYFFNCAVKKGVNTPGLFANWSYNDIGTAWHGDYHMNYNTQQPFWVSFSSNHLEKNLSYVSLIEFLMDVSKNWAKEYYELPGAFFPHSAYPVDMTMNPYPVPHWGWEVFETPWAVQGLWWHYLYSQDKNFLENRAYLPIKKAVEFLVAYMKRPEAHGEQWNDDKYHIFPTVPPELYGLQPGFEYNYDGAIDLTLTKFIFKAFQQATKILDRVKEEKALLNDISDILNHFPDYPTTTSEKYGKIFVSVPGESDQVVYNVPNALITVFPGEDFGLHTSKDTMEILKNTFQNRQNEGGNDLVFKNLQAARIGMLDLEKFKRQINYSLLPNGTAADMVMQEGGRYGDLTDYGFMDEMGIWFENFGLPAVINECLMQSYNGTIRFFPNWPLERDAKFNKLRAAGAFLVSANLENEKVTRIEVYSEAGSPLKLILPWKNGGSMINHEGKSELDYPKVEIETNKGETIVFEP